ncbi:hypothetical protein BU16DRAFT_564158 [Lophium mytilinum]|uniref:Uncharacterized protein n=1 Tax=Lophium mytilinum TaxID=390894 RepID=A0A6A6QL64_9PEZI|nr:hypothetical protein BU16DRAFT_564158 [Lophium mytilinum]
MAPGAASMAGDMYAGWMLDAALPPATSHSSSGSVFGHVGSRFEVWLRGAVLVHGGFGEALRAGQRALPQSAALAMLAAGFSSTARESLGVAVISAHWQGAVPGAQGARENLRLNKYTSQQPAARDSPVYLTFLAAAHTFPTASLSSSPPPLLPFDVSSCYTIRFYYDARAPS